MSYDLFNKKVEFLKGYWNGSILNIPYLKPKDVEILHEKEITSCFQFMGILLSLKQFQMSNTNWLNKMRQYLISIGLKNNNKYIDKIINVVLEKWCLSFPECYCDIDL